MSKKMVSLSFCPWLGSWNKLLDNNVSSQKSWQSLPVSFFYFFFNSLSSPQVKKVLGLLLALSLLLLLLKCCTSYLHWWWFCSRWYFLYLWIYSLVFVSYLYIYHMLVGCIIFFVSVRFVTAEAFGCRWKYFFLLFVTYVSAFYFTSGEETVPSITIIQFIFWSSYTRSRAQLVLTAEVKCTLKEGVCPGF